MQQPTITHFYPCRFDTETLICTLWYQIEHLPVSWSKEKRFREEPREISGDIGDIACLIGDLQPAPIEVHDSSSSVRLGNMMDEKPIEGVDEVSRTHVMGIFPQESDIIPQHVDPQRQQHGLSGCIGRQRPRWHKKPRTKRMKKTEGSVEVGIPVRMHRDAVHRPSHFPSEFGREDDTDVSDVSGDEGDEGDE